MKDEIKEILEDYGCIPRIKKLGDYITNLQEENKELKKKITFNEKSRRKMQQSLMEQIETYKSTINKANEFIKEHTNNFAEYLDVYEAKELLDILNGGDDND